MFEKRPTGALRLAYRLPILLYRARLGWLLGGRFLLLTHRGRRSGLVRGTVLEVLRHDPRTGERVVISSYGDRADWYRNILESPALEVRTGRERYAPHQRLLDAEEAEAVLSDYARRHPMAIRVFARALDYPLEGTREERLAAADSLRMVALRPRRDAA